MATLYNNGGNLELGGWAGTDGSYANYRKELRNDVGQRYAKPFAIFDHRGSYLRAHMRLLRNYLTKPQLKDRYGRVSLFKMINRYAPQIENPTRNYYKKVLQYMKQVNPNFDEKNVTNADIKSMVKAQIMFENKGLEFEKDGKQQKFIKYYLNNSDNTWEIAEWASYNSYPESTRWTDMTEGYAMANNKKNIAKETETLEATDNSPFGGGIATRPETVEDFKPTLVNKQEGVMSDDDLIKMFKSEIQEQARKPIRY